MFRNGCLICAGMSARIGAEYPGHEYLGYLIILLSAIGDTFIVLGQLTVIF